jgi:hypothetical protein
MLSYQNALCVLHILTIIILDLNTRNISGQERTYETHYTVLSKYSPQHIILNHPHNLCSSLNVRDQVSHPYRTTGKIIVVFILIFTFY